MLNSQIDDRTLNAIRRLKNNDDFKLFAQLLQDNLPFLAVQAVRTTGVSSDEFSGAYKLLEETLRLLSLEEYMRPQPVDKRFE